MLIDLFGYANGLHVSCSFLFCELLISFGVVWCIGLFCSRRLNIRFDLVWVYMFMICVCLGLRLVLLVCFAG